MVFSLSLGKKSVIKEEPTFVLKPSDTESYIIQSEGLAAALFSAVEGVA